MNNDLPPSCFFEVNEMGNKESTWSGLMNERAVKLLTNRTKPYSTVNTSPVAREICEVQLLILSSLIQHLVPLTPYMFHASGSQSFSRGTVSVKSSP